nr:histidine phosphatase family protein [Planktothrix agardhii]
MTHNLDFLQLFPEGLKEIAYGEWEGKLPQTVNENYHDDYVRCLTDQVGMRQQEGKKELILLAVLPR